MKKLLSIIMATAMLIMGLNVQVFAEGEPEYYFDYDPYRTATMTFGSERIDKDKIIVVKGDVFDIKVYTKNTTFGASRWMVDKPGIISIYGTGDAEPNRAITALAPGEVTLTCKSATSKASASIKIQVLDKDPEQEVTKTYSFAKSGYTHAYEDGIVGIHIPTDQTTPEVDYFLEKVGAKSYRSNTRFIETATLLPGETRFGGAYYRLAKKHNIPAVFNFYSQLPQADRHDEVLIELLDMVKEVKKNYDGPYIFELFNEVYDINVGKNVFPTIESYVEFTKRLSTGIKEIIPEAIVIGTGYDPAEENNLDAGGETWFKPAKEEEVVNQEYRLAHWDERVLELAKEGYVDGMTIHPYQPAGTHLTGQNQKSYMRAKFASADGTYWSVLWASRYYGDIDMYITEWGQLQANVYFGLANDAAEKARYFTQKYPAAAIFNGKTWLDYMASGVVKQSHVHSIYGGDGLGIMERSDDPYPTAQTQVMTRMTKLTEETDYYHEIMPLNMDYVTIKYPWSDVNNAYQLENVKGWGFGDAEKMTQAVFLNQTDVPQRVKLEGTMIKPTWSYGGESDKILPDFLHNKTYNNNPWTLIKDLANYKDYIFPADTHEGAKFVQEVEVPPYTIMFVDVEKEPTKIKTTSDAFSRLSNFNFKNSLILSVGTGKAYVDNVEKQVDENNADVTPIIENDRTLLPLRFVAESFGCDVKYIEETRDIIITNRFDTQKIVFTVDKETYTVDGEEKTLDVAPMIKNDRTLLPLRALAESLGKDVRWDPRGYIFIGNYAPRIDENLEYYFAEIEKLYK